MPMLFGLTLDQLEGIRGYAGAIASLSAIAGLLDEYDLATSPGWQSSCLTRARNTLEALDRAAAPDSFAPFTLGLRFGLEQQPDTLTRLRARRAAAAAPP